MANIWDLWSTWRIKRIITQQRPMIVQTYMGRATRLTRLPSQSKTVHIARLGGFYKVDGYYRHAHAWVGITQGICDYLVKSGLPANRVFRIGHFVPDPVFISDREKAELRARYGLPGDAWILFALGRLVEKKGFQDLLQAMALLPADIAGRPLVLLLAGDGPFRENLHRLATDLGLAQRIIWLGWQNAPSMFFQVADLFICPSRHEPFGVVQLEAWSFGLPMVTTATAGALELVEDNTNALICPPHSPMDLSARIKTLLLSSNSEREALGAAGHWEVQLRHSRNAIVSRYTELYGDLLKAYGVF